MDRFLDRSPTAHCLRLCLPWIKHPRSSAKLSEARPTARSAAAVHDPPTSKHITIRIIKHTATKCGVNKRVGELPADARSAEAGSELFRFYLNPRERDAWRSCQEHEGKFKIAKMNVHFLLEKLKLKCVPWVPLTFRIKSSSAVHVFFVRHYARSGFARDSCA